MKSTRYALISVALLALGFTASAIYWLWNARQWPFSTGTADVAFLGTTFGMSPQEVGRAIAKHGAQLLPYENYRTSERSPSIDTFGATLVFSDDRREHTAYYMSSIEMFDSKVEAEFKFRRLRLVSIGIHIDPIGYSRTESVVTTVDSKLRSTYQFSHREESETLAGAYTLHFASPNVTAELCCGSTSGSLSAQLSF